MIGQLRHAFVFLEQVFKKAKNDLRLRGKIFLDNLSQSKFKVAKFGQTFVSDGTVCFDDINNEQNLHLFLQTILVHSFSRVVLLTLIEAHRLKKRIMVFVTQSSPTNSGELMYKRLQEEGIRSRLITDSAIGFFMDKVDVVLVGAEAVAKNGGIINQIGAYPLAVCAKAVNKPFYVLVESYKFSKLYPLRQDDIPTHLQFRDSHDVDENTCSSVDYTPPHFITLLITDLGPLATAAVSDVLMQLYV